MDAMVGKGRPVVESEAVMGKAKGKAVVYWRRLKEVAKAKE
jgi:hypothetical protein